MALIAEESDQPTKRSHLSLCRTRLIEVADQANAYAVLVDVVARRLTVGPSLLCMPSMSDFDQSISARGSVSDHEMIAKTVPALGAVKLVKYLRIARWRRTMVQDDCGPTVAELSGSWEPLRVSR